MSETDTAADASGKTITIIVQDSEDSAKEGETVAIETPDTSSVDASNAATAEPDQNGEQEIAEPPKKRAKKSSKQSKTPQKAPVEVIPNDRYPYARSRGIRIFSDREIEVQDAEMTREYWRFWNQTAEELCSDRAYNDWGKRDLKLYIDAAWIIHKTYMQEVLERQLDEGVRELHTKHGYAETPQRVKTQYQNVTDSLSKVFLQYV